MEQSLLKRKMCGGGVNSSPNRNINLDLIRCVAVFSVVAVHFFRSTGFYQQVVTGETMWLLIIVRTAFMVCVPLFALLTGYLCSRKELSREYYKRIIPILSTYLLACILCIVYRQVWRKETISLVDGIFKILNLDGGMIDYSWYINMYIGLFLLIPFLNVLYHGLKNQQEKKLLIWTLLILTAAPSILNGIDWFRPLFLVDPEKGFAWKRIVPDWWRGIWPITYYYIGAYVREYDIKIAKRWNAILLGATSVVYGSYIFYCSNGNAGLKISDTGWGNFAYLLETVLLFLLLLHMNLSKIPKVINWILLRISKLSLGIYLCSYMSDDFLYPKFLQAVPIQQIRYYWAPIVVLCTFSMSIVMAQVIEWVQIGIKWVENNCRNIINVI